MTPKQLKASILQLAIQGKLVPQDPNDEPASELLKRIEAAKNAKGAKQGKPLPPITDDEKPFNIPDSWEWVRLGNVCTSIADGDHQPPPQQNTGIPFLVITNVSSGSVDFSSTRFVSLEYFKSLSEERIAKRGDFLITVTGSYGIIVPVETETEFCFQRHMALVKTVQVDNAYLQYVLQSSPVRKYFDHIATGCAQKTISIMSLRNTVIPFPPLAEQKRIAAKVEALFKYVDECEDSRKQLAEKLAETLKRSVLQEAIQGRLVPQDPNDEPACELLKRIAAEREKQIAEKKIKKSKPLPPIKDEEKLFPIPDSWEWVRLGEIISLLSGRDLEPQEYSASKKKFPYMTGASNFGKEGLIVNRWTDNAVTISHVNDLLITCKGTIGTMAFNTIGDIHIARQIMAISSACVNLKFIKVVLESALITLQSAANSMIPGISRETILSFPCPLPPLAEQKRIVAKVDSLLAKIEKVREAVC